MGKVGLIIIIVVAAWFRIEIFEAVHCSSAGCEQSDQIWRNFTTLATFWKSLAIFEGFSSILSNCEPSCWQMFWAIGQIFIIKMAKYWKDILAIWSHWLRAILVFLFQAKTVLILFLTWLAHFCPRPTAKQY